MIRVVYRWRVEPENFEAFRDSWRSTTNRIHDTFAGALGSFMLRSLEDACDVTTVAKWDSLESWQRFWKDNNPEAMRKMRTLGERLSADAFEEVEDHTR